MAKASAQITLHYVIDIQATYRYYLLQSSTSAKPSKPTVYPAPSPWSDAEPTYTSGSTNSLYFVDCTVFTDNSFHYSEVSKSTSYEAAKEAYNKAQNAQNTAQNAQDSVDNLKIGGRNLLRYTEKLPVTGDLETGIDQFTDKEYLTGSVVTIPNVASSGQDLEVKVASKNLITSYMEGTTTYGGVTYTHNDDGTITISGTKTGYSDHSIQKVNISPNTTYCYSGYGNSTNIVGGLYIRDANSNNIARLNEDTEQKRIIFNTTDYPQAVQVVLFIVIGGSNGTAVSETIKPELYETYTEPAKVYSRGLNLFKSYNAEVTKNGIIAKTTEDGFVKISGEYSVANTILYLFPPQEYERVIYPAGQYRRYLANYNGFTYSSDIDINFQCVYLNGGSFNMQSGVVTTATSPFYIEDILVQIRKETAMGAKMPLIFSFEGLNITEYEPYVEPQVASANADGTVTGLKSVSPTTMLYSNIDGINITCANKCALSQTNEGLKFVVPGNSQAGVSIPLSSDGIIQNGEKVILSFDYRGNLSNVDNAYLLQRTDPNIGFNITLQPPTSETEWQHYSCNLSIPNANDRTCYALTLFCVEEGSCVGEWIEIKNGSLKLEKGDKETDWSPAPEDNANVDDVNIITKTIKEYTTEISKTTSEIALSVSSLETTTKSSIEGINNNISTLQNQVGLIMKDDSLTIEIQKIKDDGVTKVDTGTGFIFDENGMTVDKTGAETNTKITENGMTVNRYDGNGESDTVLKANKDGVDAKNLHAKTFLIINGTSRFEKYLDSNGINRVGCFWIGG